MHLHGFEPQEGTIKDFITFCKHLESLLEDTESKPNKKTGSSNKDNGRKKGRNDCSNSKKKCRCNNRKSDKEKPFFCLLHRKNNTHNSDKCYILWQDVEKLKEEHKKNGSKNQRTSKQEIHAIVEFSMQAMELAKTADKLKKKNSIIWWSLHLHHQHENLKGRLG